MAAFNAGFWVLAWVILKNGKLRTGGEEVAHSTDPGRFSVYLGLTFLMGLVAAIGTASILISKAAR